jgi:Domain of unknown function (DUF4190)/GYF domain 2
MYKIKGQDQNEYGPVDAAQLRLWINEGRADAKTLARLEGATEWQPLGSFPEFAAVIAPPLLSPSAPAPPVDNPIAALVPYRNAPALIAYYLGVFSLIPCLGYPLAIGAVVLGIIGLKRARQHPESKGKVHAWIGIILGGLVMIIFPLLWFGLIIGSKNH